MRGEKSEWKWVEIGKEEITGDEKGVLEKGWWVDGQKGKGKEREGNEGSKLYEYCHVM